MSDNNIGILKERLKQNVIHIDDFNGVDDLLYYCIIDKYVIFNRIALKNYFIDNTERPVINCNSSYEKFVEEMENRFNLSAVFNNVNFCTDIRILDLIDKTNNLRIE